MAFSRKRSKLSSNQLSEEDLQLFGKLAEAIKVVSHEKEDGLDDPFEDYSLRILNKTQQDLISFKERLNKGYRILFQEILKSNQ